MRLFLKIHCDLQVDRTLRLCLVHDFKWLSAFYNFRWTPIFRIMQRGIMLLLNQYIDFKRYVKITYEDFPLKL